VTTTVGADRRADGLPSDPLGVANVPFIVVRHDNGDREENASGNQIGIDLDLGCRITVAQIVDYSINMRSQTLVGVPGNASIHNEVALRAPQLRTHTQ
jgi:hypothetical protein